MRPPCGPTTQLTESIPYPIRFPLFKIPSCAKYSLVIPNELRDFLSHLTPLLKNKIKQALVEIPGNPSVGKPLRDDLAGLNSYQVGKIRGSDRPKENDLSESSSGN